MVADTGLDDKEKILAGLKLAAPFITVGIDVGKMQDPTTIVVAEAKQRWSGRWHHLPEQFTPKGYYPAQDTPILETAFITRFVSRVPLGTDYPVVALMLARLLDNQQLQGKKRIVRIDITGVGRPVYDMLVAEIKRLPERKLISCLPITFSHGNEYKEEKGLLGKAYGVSRMQSLIQRNLVRVPPNQPEVIAMMDELKVYQIKVDPAGMDKYGAFSTGTHDDLATAMILCTLKDAIANTVTIGPKIR